MRNICFNCGGELAIHHYETKQCPLGGVESNIFIDTIFLESRHEKEKDFKSALKEIVEVYKLLKEIDSYLSSNDKNYIGSGSKLHNDIKNKLK